MGALSTETKADIKSGDFNARAIAVLAPLFQRVVRKTKSQNNTYSWGLYCLIADITHVSAWVLALNDQVGQASSIDTGR